MIYAHCFACGESWGICMPRTCKCPNQEQDAKPTAWADMLTKDVNNDAGLSWTPGHFHTTPLYEQPKREWVGLTDKERDQIWDVIGNSDAHGDVDGWSGRNVMIAIEAKLKEKNFGS